jgi:ATP-dependent exoDNAse (exonuclease V) beta subunit
MGLPEVENSFTGTHRDESEMPEPPLSVWIASSKKLDDRALEVAAGVQSALRSAEEWIVAKDGAVHSLKSGDITVLCRSSDRVSKIANALSTLGIKVAVERAGLMQTPEAELVYAALRWTADPTDRLALAEVLRLLGGAEDPGLWLRAVLADDQGQALEEAVPFAGELKALRERQLSLTPSDVIDAVTGTSGVRAYIDRLGNSAIRLDNLETLRGLARTYESECANLALPATLGGLVLWLASQTPPQPRSLDPDAVKVMTYHGAKGLEWPMVILTDLEESLKDRPFGIAAEISSKIDWSDPLANRWIRYWPWPYGAQKTNVGLDAIAGASDIGLQTTQKTRDEEIRLLYVGMTRARDHLVLVNPTSSGTEKLDLLTNTDGVPQVALPASISSEIQVGGNSHPARVIDLSTLSPESHDSVAVTHASIERATIHRSPLFVRPSEAGVLGAYRVANVVELGPRVPITGNPDMTILGEAVHAIFASDRPAQSTAERVSRAQKILDRWGVSEVVSSDVIAAVDRFLAHLTANYPGASIRREVPVFARVGEQIISGRIDVLVESDNWFAIFDHKSFPGNRAKREAAAVNYAPQIRLYADSVQCALKHECRGLYIHMPISGGLLEIEHCGVGEDVDPNLGKPDKLSER